MELKNGYKQTEIGIIPSDWEVKSYEEIFSFLTTATYSRAQMFENGAIKCVHYGDIHTKYHINIDFDKSNFHSVSEENGKKYPFLRDGDVIMADASEDYLGIGKSVEVRNVKNKRIISGLHTFLLRDKNNTLCNGYRGYIHSINIVKKQFDELATGMKVYGVSKANLKIVKVPIPTIKEQTAIANALSDTDTWINSLEQLLTKKRQIKQGAMQELLQPKDDWEVKKFSEVCWFQEGPGLRNWQFTKSGIKVINVTNLESNGYLNLGRTDRHISLDEFQKMYKHFEIDENDIVVASSGNSYGKVALVRKQDLPLLMNTSVIRFKPLDIIDYNFLFTFLRSKDFKGQIDLLITGGAQPNFGPFHLNKLLINLPKDKKEQTRISTILKDMDDELEQLETKLAKAKQLKQGMMQELLTGRIRLV